MVVTLVYYGLLLSAGQLAGNLYVNSFISGFVEIPGVASAVFAMQKYAWSSVLRYIATTVYDEYLNIFPFICSCRIKNVINGFSLQDNK